MESREGNRKRSYRTIYVYWGCVYNMNTSVSEMNFAFCTNFIDVEATFLSDIKYNKYICLISVYFVFQSFYFSSFFGISDLSPHLTAQHTFA